MIDVSNLHPNWRAIRLGHISQVRMMVREGRYVIDGNRIIKDAQRELADIRAMWQAEFNRTTHCGGDV